MFNVHSSPTEPPLSLSVTRLRRTEELPQPYASLISSFLNFLSHFNFQIALQSNRLKSLAAEDATEDDLSGTKNPQCRPAEMQPSSRYSQVAT